MLSQAHRFAGDTWTSLRCTVKKRVWHVITWRSATQQISTSDDRSFFRNPLVYAQYIRGRFQGSLTRDIRGSVPVQLWPLVTTHFAALLRAVALGCILCMLCLACLAWTSEGHGSELYLGEHSASRYSREQVQVSAHREKNSSFDCTCSSLTINVRTWDWYWSSHPSLQEIEWVLRFVFFPYSARTIAVSLWPSRLPAW